MYVCVFIGRLSFSSSRTDPKALALLHPHPHSRLTSSQTRLSQGSSTQTPCSTPTFPISPHLLSLVQEAACELYPVNNISLSLSFVHAPAHSLSLRHTHTHILSPFSLCRGRCVCVWRRVCVYVCVYRTGIR